MKMPDGYDFNNFVDKDINLITKFNEAELIEMGDRLAKIPIHIDELDRLQESLKKKVTDLKKQIESLEAEQLALAKKYESGEELRLINCKVKYDFPESVKKTIVRMDNYEKLEVDMTEADYTLFPPDEVAKEDALPEVDPTTEKFGFSVKDISLEITDEESFVVSDENDLDRIGLSKSVFADVNGCLAVRSDPATMRDFYNKTKIHNAGSIDDSVDSDKFWYFFRALNDE